MFARILLCLGIAAGLTFCDEKSPDQLDVPYEPTHPDVVEAMLKLAGVTDKDTVYDLGCGDGRIVVAAAAKFGARGFGVDIDPQRLKEAEENAQAANVADRVKFLKADLKEFEIKGATVVTLYLLNSINVEIRPNLFRCLDPGTRIVSHAFTMGEWEYDKKVSHPKARDETVLFWIMPAAAGGVWKWTEKEKDAKEGADADVPYELKLDQTFQNVKGSLTWRGGKGRVDKGSLAGRQLTCTVKATVNRKVVTAVFQGTVTGNSIEGTQEWKGGPNPGKRPWKATMAPVNLPGDWRLAMKEGDPRMNGVLRFQVEGGKPAALYIDDEDKAETKASAIYTWGSSIRFEIPVKDDTYVFTGFFEGASAAGKVAREGSSESSAWSARRVAEK
jgi:SAM-dependent methyltransferase